MDLANFLFALGMQKPLVAVQGDIFFTPADHIAFAVHWRNKTGYLNNANGGFAGLVAKYGWTELETLEFEPGIPVTKKIKGKYFHALPIHSNEENGWDDAPEFIETCLNKLPVPSTEVIACVLMGGGNSGFTYKATIKNLEGLIKTYKSVVLYVYQEPVFDLLVSAGVVAQLIPKTGSLTDLPKVYHLGERKIEEALLLFNETM